MHLIVKVLATTVLVMAQQGHSQTCKNASNQPGVCLNVNETPCSPLGSFESGFCPGAAHIKCCVYNEKYASGSSEACISNDGKAGICLNRNNVPCSGLGGAYGTGTCSAGSPVECCVFGNTPTTDEFLPDPPDTSGNQGSCTTPYNQYRGSCIAESKCTGATFNGLCPGSSKCCVAEFVPVAQKSSNFYSLSQSQFTSLFSGISETRAAAMRPYFNSAIQKIQSDATSQSQACYRVAGFVAQIGHESAGLRYFEELASGAAYEGRTDLGNTQPGDGRRYKGRGPIQLTGRSNYRSAASALGINYEVMPERVCFPSSGFETTVWFWQSRNLNQYATASSSDFITLTRRINGGTNGLADRQARWASAKTALKCDSERDDEKEIVAPTDKPTDDEPETETKKENDDTEILTAIIAAGSAGVVAIGAVGLVVRHKKVSRKDGTGNGDRKDRFSEYRVGHMSV